MRTRSGNTVIDRLGSSMNHGGNSGLRTSRHGPGLTICENNARMCVIRVIARILVGMRLMGIVRRWWCLHIVIFDEIIRVTRGADTFVFTRGSGHDGIVEFDNGKDVIDLSGYQGIDSFAEAYATDEPARRMRAFLERPRR